MVMVLLGQVWLQDFWLIIGLALQISEDWPFLKRFCENPCSISVQGLLACVIGKLY